LRSGEPIASVEVSAANLDTARARVLETHKDAMLTIDNFEKKGAAYIRRIEGLESRGSA
jgi:hypothetical protein